METGDFKSGRERVVGWLTGRFYILVAGLPVASLMTTSEIDAGAKVYDLPVGCVEGGFKVPLKSLRLGGSAGRWAVGRISFSVTGMLRTSIDILEGN